MRAYIIYRKTYILIGICIQSNFLLGNNSDSTFSQFEMSKILAQVLERFCQKTPFTNPLGRFTKSKCNNPDLCQ